MGCIRVDGITDVGVDWAVWDTSGVWVELMRFWVLVVIVMVAWLMCSVIWVGVVLEVTVAGEEGAPVPGGTPWAHELGSGGV